MTDKQIIDNINNFCLVCYYDNKTNELVHIEQYNDNDTSIHSDIESYKYGYNAEIVKPEQLIRQLDQLKAEKEKMSKGYEELTEIVSPYIDDFTGYNEELQGFDIVLCVKELMQQLDQFKVENEHLTEKEEEARHYLKETEKFKNCLTEIKEICNSVWGNGLDEEVDKFDIILKKISEVAE